MFRCIALVVGAVVYFSANSLPAQDAVLGQKYGYGVHAYFAGDYLKAYGQLSAAIDGGSKDPRAFYFRGLAYLKLGRAQEASMDFQKGAELESKDVNKFYNVAKALERVQGQARVALEDHRVEARMAALEEAEKVRTIRYETIQKEEARVLREQAAAAPTEPAKGAEPAAEQIEALSAEPGAADPFATPEEKPAAKPGKTDKKPAKPEVKEPAKEPAEEGAETKKPVEVPAAPAGDDPFSGEPKGEKKAEPAEPAKPAAIPGAKKGGLLGAMGKAIGKAAAGGDDATKAPAKPEAEKKEDKPVADKEPAAEKKPADAADPFLEEPAADKAKDAKPAAEEKPAEKKTNPEDPFAT